MPLSFAVRANGKTKGSEGLKRIKGIKTIILLGLLLLLNVPQATSAADIGTGEVGIGFASKTQQPADTTAPIDNVLPLTSTKAGASEQLQTTQVKRLPQTGDQTAQRLHRLGLLCLISVFWLFLFHQLREEDAHEST